MSSSVILGACRTAVGSFGGTLKDFTAPDLGAIVIRESLARAGVPADVLDDVLMGCVLQAGAGMNVARQAAIKAGVPNTVPAETINRVCGSGLQAVAHAAQAVKAGDASVIVAGGTESMSMVPMMGHKVAMNPAVFRDENVAIAYGMGITAEKVAEQWKVSREDQDAFALASHQKALAAIAAGEFKAEIAPYTLDDHYPDLAAGRIVDDTRVVDTDEGPRKDTSLEGLGKLKPVFRLGGSVTAGNASQMSDGAGAVLLASERALKEFNLTPLARFVSFSVAGVKPDIMGIGPIAAIPKALRQAGLSKDQLDWIELNEAFAAQALAVIRDVGLDPARVNPLGGAIALGHPLGATGAIRAATLIHGLRRRKQKYGMVTMCIGTGMGAAGIFEAL